MENHQLQSSGKQVAAFRILGHDLCLFLNTYFVNRVFRSGKLEKFLAGRLESAVASLLEQRARLPVVLGYAQADFLQPAEPAAADHLSAIAGLLVQHPRLSKVRQCTLAVLIERTQGGATEHKSSVAGPPEESARLSVVSVATQAIEIEHSERRTPRHGPTGPAVAGLLIERARCCVIPRPAQAFFVQRAEIPAAFYASAVAGLLVKKARLFVVLGHSAKAVIVEVAEQPARVCIADVASLLEQRFGFCVLLLSEECAPFFRALRSDDEGLRRLGI